MTHGIPKSLEKYRLTRDDLIKMWSGKDEFAKFVPASKNDEKVAYMGNVIVIQGKRSLLHKAKWSLKKFWWVVVLRRDWNKRVAWKWYGGYSMPTKGVTNCEVGQVKGFEIQEPL